MVGVASRGGGGRGAACKRCSMEAVGHWSKRENIPMVYTWEPEPACLQPGRHAVAAAALCHLLRHYP
jgi:hypothetical protein